jgi:hypothetical protein
MRDRIAPLVTRGLFRAITARATVPRDVPNRAKKQRSEGVQSATAVLVGAAWA